MGKIPIHSLYAWQPFLAAGSHLAGSLGEGEERQKERATLVSEPPWGPQEPEAAPEVVPDPGPCSWAQKGKAGGGDKMGGESQGLLGWGRSVAMAIREGRSQVRIPAVSLPGAPRAGLGC